MDEKKFLRTAAAIAGLGLAARLAFIFATRGDLPHTDFGSFAAPARDLAGLFHTSPREPAFVWWLWLLGKMGVSSFAPVRAATALWFVPAALFLAAAARRAAGDRGALAAAALYAFLPSQIEADALGLRHLMEGAGMAALWSAYALSPGLDSRRSWARGGAAMALLALTRVNHLAGGALLSAVQSLRTRGWKPLAALAPAAFLLLFHLRDNRKSFGDPLHSVNIHSYWFANLENVGKPGFAATLEERRKNAYKKSLTFHRWAFGRGTPFQRLLDWTTGLGKTLTVFYHRVYFARGLPPGAPWVFMALYALGFAAACADPERRFLPIALVAFSAPYALVIHVFWAGRFFVPFTPLVLTLLVLGAQRLFLRTRPGPR